MALILASASPRRLQLLAQIGVVPNRVAPAHVDERPRRDELPRQHAERMALEKAAAIAPESDAWVLAADTVAAAGRRILAKTDDPAEARRMLTLLSGRAHRVTTAVVLRGPDGRLSRRTSESRVSFIRLSTAQIEAYLEGGEWRGKAGGYAIQGYAAGFIRALSGSYSGVVGLPLFETAQLLRGHGLLRP